MSYLSIWCIGRYRIFESGQLTLYSTLHYLYNKQHADSYDDADGEANSKHGQQETYDAQIHQIVSVSMMQIPCL